MNASASLQHGWRGFWGNDLVLTIGLPLAAGLRVQELTGVLAHEFGHFIQATAMRLTYVIRWVNGWFARVVYERDEWDLKLEEYSRSHRTLYGQIVLQVSRFCVWLSRRILWILMHLGHMVSGFMSRQMEFHADQFQVRVVGTQTYRETHLQIHLLDAAQTNVEGRLGVLWRERRLVDDLPHVIAETAAEVSEDDRDAFAKAVLDVRTRWFDTHPSPAARIEHASRRPRDGAFTLTLPAADLFHDFRALARETTLSLYRERIDPDIGPHNLLSVEDLAATEARQRRAEEALTGLLRGHEELLNVGLFAVAMTGRDEMGEVAIEALEASRARLVEALSGVDDTLAEGLEVGAAIRRYGCGVRLRDAGVKFKPADLELPTRSPAALREELRELQARRESLRAAARPAADAVVEHARVACHLARATALADHLDAARAVPPRLPAIELVMERVGTAWRSLREVRRLANEFGLMVEYADGRDHDNRFQEEGGRLIGQLYEVLDKVARRFDGVAYPYAWDGGPESMIAYLFPERPTRDARIGGVALGLLEGVSTLYVRMWGDLALLVAEVEAAAGLEPPPRPEEMSPADG